MDQQKQLVPALSRREKNLLSRCRWSRYQKVMAMSKNGSINTSIQQEKKKKVRGRNLKSIIIRQVRRQQLRNYHHLQRSEKKQQRAHESVSCYYLITTTTKKEERKKERERERNPVQLSYPPGSYRYLVDTLFIWPIMNLTVFDKASSYASYPYPFLPDDLD